MKKIKSKIMYDEKKRKVGVIVSLKDLDKLYEELEDYYDYEIVKERSGKKEKTYTSTQVKAMLLGKKS